MEFTDKVVGTFIIEKNVTEQDIECIIINGLEGGIGYWAILHNDKPEFADKPKDVATSEWVTKLIIEGKSVILTEEETEVEEGESKELVLNLEGIIKGIKLNSTERPWDSNIQNGDATTYDCIIQYAVFGEVVYG